MPRMPGMPGDGMDEAGRVVPGERSAAAVCVLLPLATPLATVVVVLGIMEIVVIVVLLVGCVGYSGCGGG